MSAVLVTTYNKLAPVEGPVALRWPITLPASGALEIDLFYESSENKISFVQALAVDTTGCTVPVKIKCVDSQQTVFVPPDFWALAQVFVPNPPRFLVTGGSGEKPVLWFFNVPLYPEYRSMA